MSHLLLIKHMVLRFNLAQIWHLSPISVYIWIWGDLILLWLIRIRYSWLDDKRETLKYFRETFLK